MIRTCALLALLVSSHLAAGCASSGNPSIADATRDSVGANLVKGQSTQADVRRAYGDPVMTSFTENGKEMWTYKFARLQSKPTNFIPYVNMIHSGATGDEKSLVVMFDKNKTVADYTISTSKVETSTGLITQ